MQQDDPEQTETAEELLLEQEQPQPHMVAGCARGESQEGSCSPGPEEDRQPSPASAHTQELEEALTLVAADEVPYLACEEGTPLAASESPRPRLPSSSAHQHRKNRPLAGGPTRPHTKKGQWSEEEEMVLAQRHREIGNKWAAIAKYLPVRSDNDVKNHWNSTLRSKSLAKQSTFLWLYAKEVEHVADSEHMRQQCFDLAHSTFEHMRNSGSAAAALPGGAVLHSGPAAPPPPNPTHQAAHAWLAEEAGGGSAEAGTGDSGIDGAAATTGQSSHTPVAATHVRAAVKRGASSTALGPTSQQRMHGTRRQAAAHKLQQQQQQIMMETAMQPWRGAAPMPGLDWFSGCSPSAQGSQPSLAVPTRPGAHGQAPPHTGMALQAQLLMDVPAAAGAAGGELELKGDTLDDDDALLCAFLSTDGGGDAGTGGGGKCFGLAAAGSSALGAPGAFYQRAAAATAPGGHLPPLLVGGGEGEGDEDGEDALIEVHGGLAEVAEEDSLLEPCGGAASGHHASVTLMDLQHEPLLLDLPSPPPPPLGSSSHTASSACTRLCPYASGTATSLPRYTASWEPVACGLPSVPPIRTQQGQGQQLELATSCAIGAGALELEASSGCAGHGGTKTSPLPLHTHSELLAGGGGGAPSLLPRAPVAAVLQSHVQPAAFTRAPAHHGGGGVALAQWYASTPSSASTLSVLGLSPCGPGGGVGDGGPGSGDIGYGSRSALGQHSIDLPVRAYGAALPPAAPPALRMAVCDDSCVLEPPPPQQLCVRGLGDGDDAAFAPRWGNGSVDEEMLGGWGGAATAPMPVHPAQGFAQPCGMGEWDVGMDWLSLPAPAPHEPHGGGQEEQGAFGGVGGEEPPAPAGPLALGGVAALDKMVFLTQPQPARRRSSSSSKIVPTLGLQPAPGPGHHAGMAGGAAPHPHLASLGARPSGHDPVAAQLPAGFIPSSPSAAAAALHHLHAMPSSALMGNTQPLPAYVQLQLLPAQAQQLQQQRHGECATQYPHAHAANLAPSGGSGAPGMVPRLIIHKLPAKWNTQLRPPGSSRRSKAKQPKPGMPGAAAALARQAPHPPPTQQQAYAHMQQVVPLQL